jgi:hypothetical protein
MSRAEFCRLVIGQIGDSRDVPPDHQHGPTLDGRAESMDDVHPGVRMIASHGGAALAWRRSTSSHVLQSTIDTQ